MSKTPRLPLVLLAFVLAPVLSTAAKVPQPPNMPDVSAAPDSALQLSRGNSAARELGIALIGNVLVFSTIDDYRRVVDNPTPERAAKFRTALQSYPGFKSYARSRERAATREFRDDYFESLLNSDQVVQIGANLFRVNPRFKKVFVLPASRMAEYQDLLKENRSNPNISIYSTEQDVLDLVARGMSNQKIGPLICKEGGVGSAAAQITFPIGNDSVQTLAAFNNYGIYYSLFAEVNPSAGGNRFLFQFNNGFGYIHWHQRCGATTDYGTVTAGNTNAGLKQRFQSYQGSKNLANFFFGYRILLKSNGAPLTGMNVIRKNW